MSESHDPANDGIDMGRPGEVRETEHQGAAVKAASGCEHRRRHCETLRGVLHRIVRHAVRIRAFHRRLFQ